MHTVVSEWQTCSKVLHSLVTVDNNTLTNRDWTFLYCACETIVTIDYVREYTVYHIMEEHCSSQNHWYRRSLFENRQVSCFAGFVQRIQSIDQSSVACLVNYCSLIMQQIKSTSYMEWRIKLVASMFLMISDVYICAVALCAWCTMVNQFVRIKRDKLE